MKTPLSLLATSVGLLSLSFSNATARPATSADLSGKTICWSDGNISTFYPGGKTAGKLFGEGTWRVTSVGVEFSTKYFMNIYDVEVLSDGSISSDADYGGRVYHFEGHYCKKP
jgi:hypothetical protein